MNDIIIIDTSGSMTEPGKKSTEIYILNTLKNLLDGEPSVYTWNDKIEPFGGKYDIGGRLNIKALSSFLSEHSDSPVLVITDGCFSMKNRLQTGEGAAKVLCVTAGYDGNKTVISKLFGRENVFDACDTVTCAEKYISLKEGS